jgi:hypothetical protein
MKFFRVEVVPVVSRVISNNISNDIFGGKTTKLKKCTCCEEYKPYSDYYVKAGKQNLHRESIREVDLRSHCIPCYDHNTHKVYNKGNKGPKVKSTNSLVGYICDGDQ